ncbi:MAG TPA: DUF3943 domain-containing protein [Gemmatimonadales bacterium]
MRLNGIGWFALLVVAGTVGGRAAEGQERPDSGRTVHPSFWQAAGGVLVLNALPWAYNWYVQRWPWANVGTRVWGANFRRGFVWDDDCFLDNQFAHPYHGSFYLNSARASGYGFWGSLPYVAVGSASWELFTENVPPSLNDFINTTLGGMALGEVTFRLSSLLRAQSGGFGLGRGMAALALSPVARAQGLLSNRMRDVGATGGGDPELGTGWIAVGKRRAPGETIDGVTGDRTFLEFVYQQSSPFDQGFRKPYDAFELTLQVSPEPTGVINQIAISGLLARRELSRSPRSQLVLGLFQHYDYLDVPLVEAGSQSMSGALLYQRSVGARAQVRFGAYLEAVLLGAVSSDYGHVWRRDYDYGPGAGARFLASLRYDGRDLLRFDGRLTWVHSVYGAEADHTDTYARLGTAIRLGRMIGLGGDVGVMIRHSWYRDQPSVTRRVPETRAYLVWPPS